MNNPEDTQQDTGTDLEPSAEEPTAEANQEPQDTDSATDEATSGINEEEWKAAAAAGYQERLSDFDEVDSTPVVSLPVQKSEGDDTELKMPSPGVEAAKG